MSVPSRRLDGSEKSIFQSSPIRILFRSRFFGPRKEERHRSFIRHGPYEHPKRAHKVKKYSRATVLVLALALAPPEPKSKFLRWLFRADLFLVDR